jgi:exosortase/archaeosortase
MIIRIMRRGGIFVVIFVVKGLSNRFFGKDDFKQRVIKVKVVTISVIEQARPNVVMVAKAFALREVCSGLEYVIRQVIDSLGHWHL